MHRCDFIATQVILSVLDTFFLAFSSTGTGGSLKDLPQLHQQELTLYSNVYINILTPLLLFFFRYGIVWIQASFFFILSALK